MNSLNDELNEQKQEKLAYACLNIHNLDTKSSGHGLRLAFNLLV